MTSEMFGWFALASFVGSLSACSAGDAGTGTSSQGSGGKETVSDDGGACAMLSDGDAASIVVARQALRCELSSGAMEDCFSNDGKTCLDDDGSAGGTIVSCTNQCTASEYAVGESYAPVHETDGATETPDPPALPASCRSLGVNPGGGASFCCPCGG